MNIQTEYIFPTIISLSDHNIDDELITISKTYLNKYGSDGFLCPCKTTIQNLISILDEEPFQKLKNDIRNCVTEYCKTVSAYDTMQFSSSWLNLYSEGGYQDLHHHHNSVLSGVIYLESEGNFDFIMQSPSHFSQPIELRSIQGKYENFQVYRYPSTKGKCYIFPSNLLHRTLPATSERISLSFNLLY